MAKITLDSFTKKPALMLGAMGGIALAAYAMIRSKDAPPETNSKSVPAPPVEPYTGTGGPGVPLDLSNELSGQIDPIYTAIGNIYTQLDSVAGAQKAESERVVMAMQSAQEAEAAKRTTQIEEAKAALAVDNLALAKRINQRSAVDKQQAQKIQSIQKQINPVSRQTPSAPAPLPVAPRPAPSAPAGPRFGTLSYVESNYPALTQLMGERPNLRAVLQRYYSGQGYVTAKQLQSLNQDYPKLKALIALRPGLADLLQRRAA